jgi:hypothetical protein
MGMHEAQLYLSFRGARHKRVYARLRRAMARKPGIHKHRQGLWIPDPALWAVPE